jgi:type II secretory pathway component PulF
MPELYYEALTPTGQVTHGVLDADSLSDASAKLAACDLTPRYLSERVPLRAEAPAELSAVEQETREALRILAATSTSAALRRQAKAWIQEGELDASHSGRDFLETLLQYGERLGDPLTAMWPVIDIDRELQRSIRESRGKIVYSYVVLVICCALICAIDMIIGAEYRRMFEEFELRLTMWNAVLLQSGPVFWGVTGFLLVAPIMATVARGFFSQQIGFDRGLDAVSLWGPWRRWGYTAQALAYLGAMLKAGKPLPEACEAAASVLPRPFAAWQLRHCAERTREGAPLAIACRDAQVHPLVIPFLVASERQSMLPQGCFTASRLLLERGRRRRRFLGYVVESFALVFVLVSVLALFTSYLTPMYFLFRNLT